MGMMRFGQFFRDLAMRETRTATLFQPQQFGAGMLDDGSSFMRAFGESAAALRSAGGVGSVGALGAGRDPASSHR